MQHLIVKYQLVPIGGWMGPRRPIEGTYPLWCDTEITAEVAAEQIAQYETQHRIVIESRIVEDGLSYCEFRQRELEAERAEYLRTTPGALS